MSVTKRESVRIADSSLRTRSIWLTQLSLGVSVVIISLIAFAYEPDLFESWLMTAGVVVVIVTTAAALLMPWDRLPRWTTLGMPFADIVGVGLMSASTVLPFGFFWVFPIMWIGLHFPAWSLATALASVGGSLLVEAATAEQPPGAVELFTVLLGLTFLGVTAHLTMRQARAFKRLLLGQTRRLETTLGRVSSAERSTTELLNGVDVGILRFARTGALLAGNTAYSHLYGIDTTARGYAPTSVEYATLQGEPLPADQRTFARAQRGELFTDERVWLYDIHGSWHALSVSTKPLTSPAGDTASTMLVAHDITAVTAAERERERLAAVASHELRHPLTVILGHADLALEEGDVSPRVREHLETILGAGERMVEIASTMLRRSRAGFTPTQDRRSFDLVPVLDAAIGAFRAAAEEAGVVLAELLPESLPLSGDVFRLRQVFDNIISNAVKYTHAGGRVEVSATTAGDEAVISVSDTGIGVAGEDLEHVFDPLFRTAEAQQTAAGTGLGLGIARDIVQSHGGTLAIDSTVGHGTTVTVRLPLNAA